MLSTLLVVHWVEKARTMESRNTIADGTQRLAESTRPYGLAPFFLRVTEKTV